MTNAMYVEYEKLPRYKNHGKGNRYRAWSDGLPECSVQLVTNPHRGPKYWVAEVRDTCLSAIGATRKAAMASLAKRYARTVH